jgi:periplasmic divalent cation tolerance protein
VTSDFSDLCEVVITAPDADWLFQFTVQLVEDRLAASAHTLDTVRSVYRWQDVVTQAVEARCMIRTRRSLIPAIINRTRHDHPYELPGFIAMPLIYADPEYAAWIRDQTCTSSGTD